MTYYEYDAFTLPTIDFVGGETETLVFNLYDKNRDPVNLAAGSQCGFAITPYTMRSSTPIVIKSCTIEQGPDGFNNVVSTTLSSSDTLNLSGKYIYQLTIKSNNLVEIPQQGIIYITRNIHPGYIT